MNHFLSVTLLKLCMASADYGRPSSVFPIRPKLREKNYRETTPVHRAYISYLESTKGKTFPLKSRLQRKRAKRRG